MASFCVYSGFLYLVAMIEAIRNICGSMVGGIAYLQIVDVDDVQSIPVPNLNTHIISSAISLKTGISIATLAFIQKTAQVTETPKSTEAGDIINIEIQAQFPKNDPEINLWCAKNNARKVICLYKDENGFAKILGSKQRPLIVQCSQDSGKTFQDKNMVSVEIKGISDNFGYAYTMMVVPEVGNRAVYTAGYTFGYQRT